MSDSTFHVSENTLEDGSSTFDVYLSSPYGQELVAEPPSQECAVEMAEALNRVLNAFLDCGSDREVLRLAARLQEALRKG